MKNKCMFACLSLGLMMMLNFGCSSSGDSLPTASITTASPTFGNATTVTLTSTPAATIHYTTNGSAISLLSGPSGASPLKVHFGFFGTYTTVKTLKFTSVNAIGGIEPEKSSGPYHH